MRSVADIGGATGWGRVRPPTRDDDIRFHEYREERALALTLLTMRRVSGQDLDAFRYARGRLDPRSHFDDGYLQDKERSVSTALNPDPALRTEALEQLLTERGLATPDAMGTTVALGATPLTELENPMSTAPIAPALDTDETSAPPRANGELVFAEPWESRAFGMAVSLHDAGLFAWPQFQAALIARIAAWENPHPEGECYSYYTQWLGALEDVLAGDGTVFTDEVVQRAAELAIRPAGHDHGDAPGR